MAAGLAGRGAPLSALSLLAVTVEPLTPLRSLRWLVAGGLVAADIAALARWGMSSIGFLLVNNLVLLLSIVGIANLWAQGGMAARELAWLAAGLTLYDLGATWQTALAAEVFARLATQPFAPLLAWPTAGGQWLVIGVGDVVLAALGMLVLRRSFGRGAAGAAA